MRFFSFLFLSVLFLTACSTTVITEEDRTLPSTQDAADAQISEKGLQTLRADVTQSYVSFVGEKPGIVQHEGRFNDFDVILHIQDGVPQSLDVSINIASIETESAGLTRHLLSDDFFAVESFPRATFVSNEIVPLETQGEYSVLGDLTVHGVTLPITFQVTTTPLYALMTYEMDRLQFGVGGSEDGFTGISARVPIEAKIVWTSNVE